MVHWYKTFPDILQARYMQGFSDAVVSLPGEVDTGTGNLPRANTASITGCDESRKCSDTAT